MAKAADTRSWKGSGINTTWTTAANWSSGVYPNDGDTVRFVASDVGGSFSGKTVTLPGAYSVGLFHVSGGSKAEEPIIFVADQNSAHGLTFTGDGWLGYFAEGALWLKSGTYTFEKSLRVGIDAHDNGTYKGDKNSFWLKVGDGVSSAVLNANGTYGPILGKSSKLIADKATLDFTGKNFLMYSSSGAYITNSTMTANAIVLYNSSSITASKSTITAKGGAPTLNATSRLIADNATLDFTGQNFNMYNTSSANIKDSKTTAKLLNMSVNDSSVCNCTAVFNGGSLNLSATSVIGYGKDSKGYMYATNLTLTITGDSHLLLGGQSNSRPDATGVVDKKGGDWKIGGDLVIGAQGNSTGKFITDGGSVIVGNNTRLANVSGANGTLTIKNGTFATKSIQTAGTATLNLDGAILKARANNVNLIDSGITINIGDNGATIDTDSYSVTIASNLGTAGNTGAMAFTGGGTLTLSGEANWTGGTTVNAGTVFAFPAAQKSAIVTNGITVAISETGAGDGVTVLKITDGNGTFSADDIATMTLTGNENNRYALVLAEDGAKVAISDTLTGEYVWNGGNSAASWCTDGIWVKNNVAGNWYDSTAAVFNNSGDAATVDSAVAAASVTFRANATISGAATLTAPSVVVSEGVSATIAAITAGALEKTGPGTLTLGSSRSDVTKLSEGMLVMSGSGTSLDWSKFMFGTDATKPMTLCFTDGASIAGVAGNLDIGEAGCNTKIVKEGENWNVPGEFRLGAAADNIAEFVQNGGAMAVDGYLWVGYGGGTGTLTINSGTVEVAGNGKFTSIDASCTGTINLNAGATLKTKNIHCNENASYTLAINGGTLFALAKNSGETWLADKGLIHKDVCVTVGDLGGTINANHLDNVIAAPIKGEGTGGMTFMGGGSVTLAAGNTYKGKTTVEVGTVVHVAAPGDIGGGLEVTLPDTALAEDVYTLVAIEGEGTFEENLLSNVVAPENATLRLSADKKSVICIYGNPDNTWVGGASGSLNEAANWSLGIVPSKGMSCVIGSQTAANLDNPSGSAFAPSTITFPAYTALIKISGDGEISGLTSIVNESSLHHEIACPLDATDFLPEELPLAEGNYLVFSGGIALKTMPSVQDMWLAGVWNLTGDWKEPPSGTRIVSGSTITVSGVLESGYNITVCEGATLKAQTACVRLGADDKNRVLYENKGDFFVSDVIENTILSSENTMHKYNLSGLFAKGGRDAVTRVNGLVHAASTAGNHRFRLNNKDDSVMNKIVLGSGGLSFRNNLGTNKKCYPYFQIDKDKSVELASSADWSFEANPVAGRELCLELEGHLYIDTSDYDNRDEPHTVRVKGVIGNGYGKVTVNGCGKLLFECASSFGSGLFVKDNATVSCNIGCAPANSTIDVGSSAAFEVAQSGDLAIGKGMVLADGATLKFNFTKRNEAPVINFANNSVSVVENGQVKIDISAQGFTRPAVGVYELTKGLTAERGFATSSVALAENTPDWVRRLVVDDTGNILLHVSVGTKIIVR